MYQVLYRKYRPKVFADVYGQEHVTSTLKNEIKENRIAHAYLFTGSRGTGKTTCAKILAKAVNCENSVDGEPCNECEVCKGLDSGTIYDVVEIDAASNNGVDNIRDLREEANYTPSRGKYRVYIIDEVHMLSTGAFNALLKTLEEPPAHVIFILATTEVHKLPATILSRCQRFDFKRIQPETMSVRLKQVAQLEGMELDDDAAILIARIADGALRDGLSILDQCAGRSKKIDSALVSEVAGLAGREALYKLTDCICTQNSSSAMTVISELYQNSYDMERLCVEMINHLRNFLIVKTVKDSRGLIICTDDEYNSIILSAENFTLENVIFALDLFQDALTKIKTGANARVELEMAFVKLCEPKLDVNIDSLVDRISKLERAVNRGVNVSQQPAVVEGAKHLHVMYVPAVPDTKHDGFDYKLNSDLLTRRNILLTWHSSYQSWLDNAGISATVASGVTSGKGISVKAMKEVTKATGLSYEQIQTLKIENERLHEELKNKEHELSVTAQKLQTLEKQLVEREHMQSAWGSNVWKNEIEEEQTY